MSLQQRIACAVMCVAFVAIILGPDVQSPDLQSEDSMRKIVSQAEPTYPEMARRMGSRGEAKLELLIGSDGRVMSAKPMSGNPLLSAAAIDAARKSKYEPGVETTMVVVYHFAP